MLHLEKEDRQHRDHSVREKEGEGRGSILLTGPDGHAASLLSGTTAILIPARGGSRVSISGACLHRAHQQRGGRFSSCKWAIVPIGLFEAACVGVGSSR